MFILFIFYCAFFSVGPALMIINFFYIIVTNFVAFSLFHFLNDNPSYVGNDVSLYSLAVTCNQAEMEWESESLKTEGIDINTSKKV